MTLEDDIEELSFEDSVRPPRKHHTWLRVILAMLLTVLVAGGATGGWYLWNYHLRRIPVTVNRVDRLVRIDVLSMRTRRSTRLTVTGMRRR